MCKIRLANNWKNLTNRIWVIAGTPALEKESEIECIDTEYYVHIMKERKWGVFTVVVVA